MSVRSHSDTRLPHKDKRRSWQDTETNTQSSLARTLLSQQTKRRHAKCTASSPTHPSPPHPEPTATGQVTHQAPRAPAPKTTSLPRAPNTWLPQGPPFQDRERAVPSTSQEQTQKVKPSGQPKGYAPKENTDRKQKNLTTWREVTGLMKNLNSPGWVARLVSVVLIPSFIPGMQGWLKIYITINRVITSAKPRIKTI